MNENMRNDLAKKKNRREYEKRDNGISIMVD